MNTILPSSVFDASGAINHTLLPFESEAGIVATLPIARSDFLLQRASSVPREDLIAKRKWGALVAETADFIENAMECDVDPTSDSPRRILLAKALSTFVKFEDFSNGLSDMVRDYCYVLVTYISAPILCVDNSACKTMISVLRNLAGYPNASEKDIARYTEQILDAGIELISDEDGEDERLSKVLDNGL